MLYLYVKAEAFANALFSKAIARDIHPATNAVRSAAMITAVTPLMLFNIADVTHIPKNKTPRITAVILTLRLLNLNR